MRFKDLTGQRFEKLMVMELSNDKPAQNKRRKRWKCICECGRSHIVESGNLLNGSTTNCGHPPCAKRRLKLGEASFNCYFKSYVKQAKNRGLDFTLNRDEFRFITSQDCVYCGQKPSYKAKKGHYGTYPRNGIDRIDNSKSYSWENSVSCCSDCNLKKHSITKQIAEKFLDLLQTGNPFLKSEINK